MFNYSANKNFYKFVFLSLVILGVGYLIVYLDYLSAWSFLIFGGVSLIVLAVSQYYFTWRPLKNIAKEVAALIASKPYSKVKVVSHDEYALIAHFFNDITDNLEKLSYTLKEGERMASELQLASDIQRSVLPKNIPQIPKLDTVAKTRSAEEVGGDSFDISQNGEQYFIYIGDVTGHGAPAGLIMMMVNTLFDVLLPTVNNTKDLANKINSILKPRVNQSMFMTTNFLRWDPNAEKLFYTGCGHEHLIIFRSSEGICEVVAAGGIALAMADDISQIVEEKEIPLKEQDMVILYSDGLTEAANSSGELFGLERLKVAAQKHCPVGDALRVFEGIATEVTAFAGDTIQRDDMTLIVMRYAKTVVEADRPQNLVNTSWNEQTA